MTIGGSGSPTEPPRRPRWVPITAVVAIAVLVFVVVVVVATGQSFF